MIYEGVNCQAEVDLFKFNQTITLRKNELVVPQFFPRLNFDLEYMSSLIGILIYATLFVPVNIQMKTSGMPNWGWKIQRCKYNSW